MRTEVDHIDPRWEEGRDYQLVCGFDNSCNYHPRDKFENQSKNNRFLPWRTAADEVGCVPVSKGDLCLFLDTDTGDWVLEEFLGGWWMQRTKHLCGPYYAHLNGKNTDPVFCSERGKKGIRSGKNLDLEYILERNSRGGQVAGALARNNRTGIFARSPEQVREDASCAGKVGGKKVAAQRWMCTESGHISNAGALSIWQRNRGIDTSNRIRLE
jgi:hypothetical protein